MSTHDEDQEFAGTAPCGCFYHAEEGVPCEHDRALAREARERVPRFPSYVTERNYE